MDGEERRLMSAGTIKAKMKKRGKEVQKERRRKTDEKEGRKEIIIKCWKKGMKAEVGNMCDM